MVAGINYFTDNAFQAVMRTSSRSCFKRLSRRLPSFFCQFCALMGASKPLRKKWRLACAPNSVPLMCSWSGGKDLCVQGLASQMLTSAEDARGRLTGSVVTSAGPACLVLPRTIGCETSSCTLSDGLSIHPLAQDVYKKTTQVRFAWTADCMSLGGFINYAPF